MGTTLYVSYGFIQSLLPQLKAAVYYCSVIIADFFMGPNAWRQHVVRDAPTCKKILGQLQRHPPLSMQRDCTGNANRPAGFIMSTSFSRGFFIGYVEYGRNAEEGMTISLWCSHALMDSLCSPSSMAVRNEEKGEAKQIDNVETYGIEANISWGALQRHVDEYPKGSYSPRPGSKQEAVLQSMVEVVRTRERGSDTCPAGGCVIMICGGSRTGKTEVGGTMLAIALGAKLLRSVDFTNPGQWLNNIVAETNPSVDDPVILLMNEWDTQLAAIKQGSVEKNLNVRTQWSNKTTLNDTIDEIRRKPGLILVVTTNKTPLSMLHEEQLLCLSTLNRFNSVHYLNERLDKGDTAPSFIDPELPGAAHLQATIRDASLLDSGDKSSSEGLKTFYGRLRRGSQFIKN